MVLKKPDHKKPTRSRHSLISTRLSSELRGTAQVGVPEQPWRDQKRKINKRGKQKK